MKIEKKARMNRVYITGDTSAIRELLSDFRARHDSAGYWLPLYQERSLLEAIAKEKEYQALKAAQLAAWNEAKSVIPADYKTRHGAAYGGTVSINGESIDEPALDTSKLPWQHLAAYKTRVRDLTGQSLINGRVQNSTELYSAVTADGRTIYRIYTSMGFGDDCRETYYLPEDLWRRMMSAEVRQRKISVEQAKEWLSNYKGCVGTELYEFAASQELTDNPSAGLL